MYEVFVSMSVCVHGSHALIALCRSCSACNHSAAFKRMELWKLPPILLINLKRFTFEGQWREKRQNYIDYPVRYTVTMTNTYNVLCMHTNDDSISVKEKSIFIL